jgi:hypothetical protein
MSTVKETVATKGLSCYQPAPAYYRRTKKHKMLWAIYQFEAVHKARLSERALRPHIYRLLHDLLQPVLAHDWTGEWVDATVSKAAAPPLPPLTIHFSQSLERHLAAFRATLHTQPSAPLPVEHITTSALSALDRVRRAAAKTATSAGAYNKEVKRAWRVEAEKQARLYVRDEWTAAEATVMAAQILAAGDQKLWVTMGDSLVCARCHENANAGPIPAGATFPSGHDRPPLHPHCRCGLRAVKK